LKSYLSIHYQTLKLREPLCVNIPRNYSNKPKTRLSSSRNHFVKTSPHVISINQPTVCLLCNFRKFYPSINHKYVKTSSGNSVVKKSQDIISINQATACPLCVISGNDIRYINQPPA
jgi:hypothetical protein